MGPTAEDVGASDLTAIARRGTLNLMWAFANGTRRVSPSDGDMGSTSTLAPWPWSATPRIGGRSGDTALGVTRSDRPEAG